MSSNKQILYISYDGMTDPLGQSQVISYMRGLSKQGYLFTIISFEKAEKFKQKGDEIRALLALYNIIWHPLIYTKKPPVLSTLYDFWRMNKLALKLQKANNYTIVHCRSYLAALVGLNLKNKYRRAIKFIFDMRGFWIEERVDGQMWNLNNTLYKRVYRFFKRKEQQFWEYADHIVILTNAGKRHMVNQEHIPAEKIGVIPTCVDFDIFKLTTSTEQLLLKKQLGIAAQAKVFIYAGAVGGSYSIDIVFKAFALYRQYFKQAHLLLLTKDAVAVNTSPLLQQYQINADELSVVEAPFTSVYQYLNIGDLGFVFYNEGWSNIARSPTKMGEYLACGLPVLVYGSIGDIDDLQNNLNIAIVNELTEPECFAAFDKINVENEVKSTRNAAFNYCSLESGVAFYSHIYKDLNSNER